jgi:hypothetical protein
MKLIVNEKQGGYLHQFSMDDKVSPEKTIYIPNTTIVPSIDIHQLSKETVFAEYGSHDTSNTFEICRPASNVLQRDKISLFRTSTREELISWCRLLLHIASGASINSLNIETDQETNLSNSSSTFDEFENQPSVSIVQSCTDSIMSGRKGSVNTVTLASTAPVTAPPPTISIPTKTPSIVSSPARSIRSVRTEESFNEPAAMTKTASFLRDNDLNSTEKTHTASSPTLISTVIAEEETNNSTDAESFVTARFSEKNMDTDEENDEDEEEFIDDYFSISQVAGESKYDSDNDAVSIASTSTAKGPTTTAAATTSNSPVTKSPSLASTTFDDAQSSLYFSSASAPNSPTASNRSSIVSVPDFQLFPEVISYVNVNGGADDHNTRLSAAEMYKATLKLTLEDDDGDDYDDSNNDNKKV